MATLVSFPTGALVFDTKLDDLSPLLEVAPAQRLALDVLALAWLTRAEQTTDKYALRTKVDDTIKSLLASFKGTDGVTLLSFITTVYRRLDAEVSPAPITPEFHHRHKLMCCA